MRFLIVDNSPTSDNNRAFQAVIELRVAALTRLLREQSYGVLVCKSSEIPKDLTRFEVVVLFYWPDFDLEIIPTSVKLVLDLGRREIVDSCVPDFGVSQLIERKLRVFARADHYLCSSSRDRNYFYGWIIQSGVAPAERELVSIFDPSHSIHDTFLDQLFSSLGDNGRVRALGRDSEQPSYGLIFSRSRAPGQRCPVQSRFSAANDVFEKDHGWLVSSGGQLSQVFVLPEDGVHSVGIRIQTAHPLSWRLVDRHSGRLVNSGSLERAPALSEQGEIHWLRFGRFTTPRGGDVLEFKLENPSANGSFKVASSLDQRYPLVARSSEDCGSPGVHFYFLVDEFSSIARSKILIKRAFRMLKQGEWDRFGSALGRRISSRLGIFENRFH